MPIRISLELMNKLAEDWSYWYEKCDSDDANVYFTAPEDCLSKRMQDLYWCKDGDKYIGIDNTTYDCWTEEFEDLEVCIDWLNGLCDSDGGYYEN